MKSLAAAAACLSLAIGASTIHAQEALKSIVESYLEIQAQLAGDRADGVKSSATAIAAKAESMGEPGAAIAKAAKALSASTDLKTARESFGPLSDAVIAAMQAAGYQDPAVKLAFCPMVRRSWLQKDEKVRNPYFGSSMLDCGEFKK
jgi:aminopeptidase N